MADARALLPTDLLTLVARNRATYRNEAWTRERLGADESARALGMVLDQFLAFARGRNAWVVTRRGLLQGLIGARQRGGRQAWEIDYLIDSSGDSNVVASLLDCAVAEAGRGGAEKLFLRLSAGSDLLSSVREAGFMPYQEEVLYARGYGRDPEGEVVPLRPVVASDSYLLYRLYNAALPEATRRNEAATFGEWHAAQERRWLRNGVQLLSEKDGEVSGYIRAARLPQGVLVELLMRDNALDQARGMLAAAAKAVDAAGAPLFVIVPRVAEGLMRRIEDSGFSARGDYVCFVRRTTRPITMPKLLPAIENAVGAS